MGLMVLNEQDPLRIDTERLPDAILHPQLVEEPRRDRLPEDSRGLRHLRKRRLQDSIELDERLFEEGDVVQVLPADAGFVQTELDRARGKAEIMFHPGEALLFGGGEERAVPQDRRGRIVEIAGDAEDVHQNWRRASSIAIGGDSLRTFQSGRPALRRPNRRINPIGTTTIQYNSVRTTKD